MACQIFTFPLFWHVEPVLSLAGNHPFLPECPPSSLPCSTPLCQNLLPCPYIGPSQLQGLLKFSYESKNCSCASSRFTSTIEEPGYGLIEARKRGATTSVGVGVRWRYLLKVEDYRALLPPQLFFFIGSMIIFLFLFSTLLPTTMFLLYASLFDVAECECKEIPTLRNRANHTTNQIGRSKVRQRADLTWVPVGFETLDELQCRRHWGLLRPLSGCLALANHVC